MSKDRIVTFAVTDEEHRLIMTKIAKRAMEEGTRVNLSKYIRELIKADLNGNKNVSSAAIDTDSEQPSIPTTDSKQKNSNWDSNWEFNFDELDT